MRKSIRVCRKMTPTNKVKKLGFFIALASSLFASQAYAGLCTPNAGPGIYNIPWTVTLTDPSQNKPGDVWENIGSWKLETGGYVATCDCVSGSTTKNTYFWTFPPDGAQEIVVNGLSFYKISEFLSVATKIYIAGRVGAEFPAPLVAKSNGMNGQAAPVPCANRTFDTGGQGSISLRFERAFVGTQTFNNVLLMKVVGATSPTDPVTSSSPTMAEVYLTGSVTVPQSCTVNAGQVLTFDFGTMTPAQFTTAGKPATGVNKVTRNFVVACNNVGQDTPLSLELVNGKPVDGMPSLLSTTNADVGVQFQDVNGSAVAPVAAASGGGDIPFVYDYTSQTGTATLSAQPFSTTGKPPVEGDFSGTAEVKVTIK